MTMLRKAITAGCIAATLFIGSTTPTSAQQVPGGGKECDIVEVIILDEFGFRVEYLVTCVEIKDAAQ